MDTPISRLVTHIEEGDFGASSITSADGTVTEDMVGPDPRFGMGSPVAKEITVILPSGLTSVLQNSRTVTLADDTDVLSHTELGQTTTVNGQIWSSTFVTDAKTWTAVSPEGRVSETVINDQGRPVVSRSPGLEDVTLTYDDRGRLTQAAQAERTSTYTYHESGDQKGLLATVTDPAGRITRQDLPGDRTVTYTYDPDGNLSSITPPGRTPHVFTYTDQDLTESYVPPVLPDLAQPATVYHYNLDEQLTNITRPGGTSATLDYDAVSGKLTQMTTPQGATTFVYQADGGRYLSQITVPDGGTLNFTYDGALITGTTWAGEVAGPVSWVINNNFQVTSRSVNGGSTISFAYDNDDLLTSAGALALARDSASGFLTGTTLGGVTDSISRNDYGEPTQTTALFDSSTLYDLSLTRDLLGRITSRTQNLLG